MLSQNEENSSFSNSASDSGKSYEKMDVNVVGSNNIKSTVRGSDNKREGLESLKKNRTYKKSKSSSKSCKSRAQIEKIKAALQAITGLL
jgi:hypothetical protein